MKIYANHGSIFKSYHDLVTFFKQIEYEQKASNKFPVGEILKTSL